MNNAKNQQKTKKKKTPNKKLPKHGYTYYAKVLRVVDGDTIEVNIDLGFKTHLITSVRVAGINCPEKRASDEDLKRIAYQAHHFTSMMCSEENVLLETQKFEDKYGRYLARVIVDNEDLGEALLNAGLGMPYDGGYREEILLKFNLMKVCPKDIWIASPKTITEFLESKGWKPNKNDTSVYKKTGTDTSINPNDLSLNNLNKIRKEEGRLFFLP